MGSFDTNYGNSVSDVVLRFIRIQNLRICNVLYQWQLALVKESVHWTIDENSD